MRYKCNKCGNTETYDKDEVDCRLICHACKKGEMIKATAKLHNRKKRNPLNIATFDIEAVNWINPICLGFYDGLEYIDFEGENCVFNFIQFLFKNNEKYSKYKIYAHFGGIYDFMFLINEFNEVDLLENCEMIINGQSIIKLSYEDNDNFLLFMDSGQLLPKSLKDLTRIFEVEHKKQDLDRGDIGKYPMKTILEYLKYDCIGLHEVIIKAYKQFKKEKDIYPALTLAATGYKAFDKVNKYQIECVNNLKLDDYLRQSYRGGRVEVFKTTGYNLIYLDFNSLYPSVMINGSFPIGKYFRIVNKWEKYLEDGYKGFGVFDIETPKDLHIPLLPLKLEKKLYFPLGKFTDCYSFTEIKRAVELGYEVKFKHGYIASTVDDLFTDYITMCYDDRLKAKAEGNQVNDYLNKILMNSTYGKFGEKKQKDNILFTATKEEFASGDLEVFSDEPLIYKMKDIYHREYHNVGIASEITTLARLRLFDEMEKIQKLGYEIYYCDTDSIITNCPADKLNISNTVLGELKLEHNILEGLFISPKLYMLKLPDNKIKFVHKGFRNINITFEELKEMYFKNKMNKLMSKFTTIAKFKSAIKRIEVNERKTQVLAIVDNVKSFKSYYDKRKLIGIHTKPLIIDGKMIMGN